MPSAGHQGYADISQWVVDSCALSNVDYSSSVFSGDIPSMSGVTGEWRYRVLYVSGGPLVCWWDPGSSVVSDGETVTLTPPEPGLFITADGPQWFFVYPTSGSCYKSADEESRTVSVRIDRTFLGAASVRLCVSGAKESTIENFGIGANFTGQVNPERGPSEGAWVADGYERSYRVVNFAEGETSRTVELLVLANPVAEDDRAMVLSLSSQSAGEVVGGDRTITIIDDYVTNVVDVSPGAGTLETALVAARVAGEKSLLRLAAGTYYCDSAELGYHATYGLSIVGAGVDQTVIKRTADYHGRSVDPTETLLSGLLYSGQGDAKEVAVSKLTLDGDQLTVGTVLTYYKSLYTIQNGDYFQWDTLDGQGDVVSDTFTFKTTPTGGKDVQIAAGDMPQTWANLKTVLGNNGYDIYDASDSNTYVLMADNGNRWAGTDPTSSPNSATTFQCAQTTGSSLVAVGRADDDYDGMVPVRIEKVKMMSNQPSDGLWSGRNASVEAYFVSEDASQVCGRGLLNLDGGYSSFNLKEVAGQCVRQKPTVAGYSDGTDARLVQSAMSGVSVKVLDISFAGATFHPGCSFYGTGLASTEEFRFEGGVGTTIKAGTPYLFEDCDFAKISLNDSVFLKPQKLVFRRTKFTLKNVTGGHCHCAPYVDFRDGGSSWPSNQYVDFQGCEFAASNVSGFTELHGVARGYATNKSYGCQVILSKDVSSGRFCTFTGASFTSAVGRTETAGGGGTTKISGVDSANCAFLVVQPYSTTPFKVDIDGANCVWNHSQGMLKCAGGVATGSGADHELVLAGLTANPMTYQKGYINPDTTAWSTACNLIEFKRSDGASGPLRSIVNSPLDAPDGTKQGLRWVDGSQHVFYDQWKVDEAPTWKYCDAMGATTTWGDTIIGELFSKRVSENWTALDPQSSRDPRLASQIIAVSWENNSLSYTNSGLQRMRACAGADNLIGRYICGYRGDMDNGAVGVNAPSLDEIDAYFGAVNTDGSDGVFQHLIDPLYEDGLTVTVTVSTNYTFTRSSGTWPSGLAANKFVHFRGFVNAANNAGFKVVSGAGSSALVVTKISSLQTAAVAETSVTGAVTAAYRFNIWNYQNYWWTRFGEDDWLEFLFGLPDGSGKRSDDSDCWVVQKYFGSGETWHLFCHENLPFNTYSLYPVGGADPIEAAYGDTTGKTWEEKVHTYFQAFKDRILTPRGKVDIDNSGQCRVWGTGGKTWFEIMAHIDGFYTENLLSDSSSWFNSGELNSSLYRTNLQIQWLCENDKIAALNASNSCYAFRVARAAGGTIRVTGSRIEVNLGTLQTQTLVGQTVADIIDWINGLDPGNLVADQTNCSPFITADMPAETLLHGYPVLPSSWTISSSSAATLSSSPLYMFTQEVPRAALLRMMSFIWLAAPAVADKVYFNPGGNSALATPFYSDVYYACTLIGEPNFTIQPKNMGSWDTNKSLHGIDVAYAPTAEGVDCFYRVFANGVAFFNWSGSEKTLNSNDSRWGSQSSWYDLRDYSNILTPGASGQATSTSVTLPDKAGTICLFAWR